MTGKSEAPIVYVDFRGRLVVRHEDDIVEMWHVVRYSLSCVPNHSRMALMPPGCAERAEKIATESPASR